MLKIISLFLFLLSFYQGIAQLMASSQHVQIGTVSLSSLENLEIPILNQSREVLTFYSLNSNGQGMQSLPVKIEPYQKGYFSIPADINQRKIDQEVIFESKDGITTIHLKGTLKSTSANSDCYDFSKSNVRTKNNGKIHTGNTNTDLIRVYSASEKNTLFTSDPKSVPNAHLVILLDASGSMGANEKLDDLKESLIHMLVQMRPDDMVTIFRYSDSTELVLKKTRCENIDIIKESILSIEAGGFTNGMNGISTGIDYLRNNQIQGYSNNLLMFSDGAFNFGSDMEEIRRYLLGQHISLSYKFSIMAVKSSKVNNKHIKDLVKSGKGFYFDLEKENESQSINRILLKQLSS